MVLEIIADYPAPGRGPAGLAWDGQSLWHADFREGQIFRLNAGAEVVETLWCPGMLSGLTWDGRHLWQALFDEGTIRSIDPITTDFDQTLDLKAHGLLSGAAWDGTNLRVIAQQTGDILTVDSQLGRVLGKVPGPVAAGDFDYREGSLWLSAAIPMVYSAENGFSWLSDEPTYALLELDAETGRELVRISADGLFTGLTWGQGGDLWLASAVEQRIYRAIISAD